MKAVVNRLQSLAPVIEQICQISRTPGASIGVMQNGRVIYTKGFGHRDLDTRIAPDENTLYHIASLTKLFTATAALALIDEEKLQASAPIVEVVPEFHARDQYVQQHVNIIDILSHRVGIAGANSFWSQGGNRNHLKQEDLITTLGSIPQVEPFRDTFLYHNMLYGFVANVVEKLSGQTYGNYLTDKILQPLKLSRTFIKVDQTVPDNYAKAYMPLTDGSYVEISKPESTDGTVQASAGGVRSCVKDLLTFYNEILRAERLEKLQACGQQESTIKNVRLLTAAHNYLPTKTLVERSYALGLFRVQTPNSFGDIGMNPALVETMPTLGADDPSRLVLFHQGSYPGYLSSAFLVPDDELVIVVLTNSRAYNDAADWIGQLLLEQILNLTHKTDFVALAKESKDKFLGAFETAEKKFDAERHRDAAHKPLKEYCGRYYNGVHTFYIEVFQDEQSNLKMCFQGGRWDTYDLKPYADDIFVWYTSVDDQSKRGRWPNSASDFFKFKFSTDDNDNVMQLTWKSDPKLGDQNVFHKSLDPSRKDPN